MDERGLKVKARGEQQIILRYFRSLAEQLRQKADENGESEAALAFEASASSLERVCDEVQEMISTDTLRPVH